MEEGQANIETPVEAPVVPNGPVFKNEKKKAGKGMIAGLIILAVLAIGGIAFGVWAMLSQGDKIASLETDLANCAASNNDATENVTVTCPDGTSTEIIKNVITNDLAQNLINPYLGPFGHLYNVLDVSEFNDVARVIIAFHNLEPEQTYGYWGDGATFYKPRFDSLNKKYQEMFGSSSTLEKKDYMLSHSLTFTYSDEAGGSFEVHPFAGGGAGAALFSVVKNAKFDGNSIIVEVYHDNVPVCGFNENDGYCINTENQGAVVNSIDQYNMRDLINNFADSIPVYTMAFVKDDGHYVLSSIQKQ